MNPRIVVIDDELAVRQAFEIALGRIGYEVVTAASGEEGLARIREVEPALVFLDLRMPGMDGVETLHRLRTEYPTTPPHVYIVTAFRPEYLAPLKSAAKTGLAFQVLDKPVTDDQIALITKSVMEGPQAE